MLDFSKVYKTTRKDKAINTRIPEILYSKYKKISQETNYPFNGLILYAMNYALKDKEKKRYETNISDIRINVRYSSELYTEYKKLGKNSNRSINSLVVSAMYYFLEDNNIIIK